MCEVLEVSRAGYYRWCKRALADRHVANLELLDFLKERIRTFKGILGYRKLWHEAEAAGYCCSKNRIQRLLQGIGYRSCTAKKPSFKSKSGLPVLPNLLNRDFTVSACNRVWVSDITQVRCNEGWLYVAVVLDLHSRRVVGWAAGCQNTAQLVIAALSHAWKIRRPNGQELLFHSDQGSQYHSEEVMGWLNKRKVTISMSRKGNCWDNACAESFFAQLKKEWLYRLGQLSRQDTIVEVGYYIEEFYDKVRRHGTLNMLTPAEFEMAA